MIPVIALVGRPNVGKSTLFNRFTGQRDALVYNQPGVTRDRIYGQGVFDNKPFVMIDTGGLAAETDEINQLIQQQVRLAIQEADHIFFVVDATAGLTNADEAITQNLRSLKKPVTVLVNKAEGLESTTAASEFYQLGFAHVVATSATTKMGINALLADVLADAAEMEATVQTDAIRMAVIGRPNVGKSTLVNALLGEDRVVVCDQAHTTRDSVFIPFTRRDQDFVLIDTAGVRRRARVKETLEKFSVVKTLQAVEQAHVILYVIDAKENISEQDLHLIDFVLQAGRSVVVVVNKWDHLPSDHREQVKSELERRLSFLSFAKWRFISALHGTGVGHLFEDVQKAYRSAFCDLNTARLTDLLEQATFQHQPPLVKGRRIRLRLAHPGGHNPPTVVIHGKQTQRLPGHYQRYLEKFFIKALKLEGTPVRIILKNDENPYA